MRKGFGICCIALGICCLIASVGFIVYNNLEEKNAQDASTNILQAVRENILDNTGEEMPPEEASLEEMPPEEASLEEMPPEESALDEIVTEEESALEEIITKEITLEEIDRDESEEIAVDIPKEMLTAQVDGYDCIGVLSIPVLELELPVLTDWSYEKLKIAPCHYFGSYYEKNFVIAAHNYRSQFGRLSEMQPKDLVLLTDISGTIHCYEVVLLETLPAAATEEMLTSGFDLSLYTCTIGGDSRVTVRCNVIE